MYNKENYKRKPVTITMNKNTHDKLRALADKYNISMSSMIEKLVKEKGK